MALQTEQLAWVVARQDAQLSVDREGYLQIIARLRDIEATQLAILSEMQIGGLPA